MAYTLPFTFQLGATKTGQAANMRARFLDSTGAATGSVISAGFFESPGNLGNYGFYPTVSTGFAGFLRVYHATDATIELLYGIDPQEYENTDVKTSTVSASGSDPLLNLRGSYASDTMGGAIQDIGTGQISVSSPVRANGDSEVFIGYDMLNVNNDALVYTDTPNQWPTSLFETDGTTPATITFLTNRTGPDGAAPLTIAGSVVVGTGTSKIVMVQPLASQTTGMAVGTGLFDIMAQYASGGPVKLVSGRLVVRAKPG